MSKRTTKYTAREILELQIEYLQRAVISLNKIDWKREDPHKIVLKFPIYIKNMLEGFVDLSLALLNYDPKTYNKKQTN